MSTEQTVETIDLDDMVFFEDDIHVKTLAKDSQQEDTSDEDEDEQEDNTEYEEQDDDVQEEESEDSESKYTNQYNYLKELGLISTEDNYEFEGTAEALEKVVNKTKQDYELAGAASIWDKLPNDFKIVLEYALAGGTDINKVQNLIAKTIDYDKVDIEDEDDQERVTRQLLKKTTQFDDRKIDNYIKKLKLAGGLEEEAETALEELKNIDVREKQQLIEDSKREQVERQQLMVNSYNKFNEVVTKMDGIDKRRKDEIISSIWQTGTYGEHENVSRFNYVDYLAKSNPDHLAQLAQIYLSYDTEKGFLSNELEKKAMSKATKTLRDTFDKFDTNSGKAKVKDNIINPKQKGHTSDSDKLAMWLKQSR